MPNHENQQTTTNLLETESAESTEAESATESESTDTQDQEIDLERPTFLKILKKKTSELVQMFFVALALDTTGKNKQNKERLQKDTDKQKTDTRISKEKETQKTEELAQKDRSKKQEIKAEQKETAKEATKTQQRLDQRRFDEVHLREKITKSIHQKEKAEKAKATMQAHIMEKGLLMTPVGSIVGMKKFADVGKATFNQMNNAYYRKTDLQKGISTTKTLKKDIKTADTDQLKDINKELDHLKDLDATIADKLYRLDSDTRRYILERTKHMAHTDVPRGDIHQWVESQCKSFNRKPVNKRQMNERLNTKDTHEPSLIRNKPKN